MDIIRRRSCVQPIWTWEEYMNASVSMGPICVVYFAKDCLQCLHIVQAKCHYLLCGTTDVTLYQNRIIPYDSLNNIDPFLFCVLLRLFLSISKENILMKAELTYFASP